MNALIQSTVPADGMNPTPLIVAAACDPTWRAILEAEGFTVRWYDTVDEAADKIAGTEPAALITGVLANPTARRRWLVTTRTSDELRTVPWIVVADEADDALLDVLDAGADDFIVSSTESGLFGLRLQALLRMIDRLRSAPKKAQPITGSIGAAGGLSLLKLCENRHITGRLTAENDGETVWVLFKDGDLVEAGPSGDRDPLDTLLGWRSGSYRIDHDMPRMSEEAARLVVPQPEEPRPAPLTLPPGRLSRVDCDGQSFQIQTEGRNEPNFTITTIVDVGGRIVRKIETAWAHPLRRRDDLERASAEIDGQHKRVTRKVQETADQQRRAPATAPGDGVAATALIWAAYFVTEHVCSHVGTSITDSILRRTHERLCRVRPALARLRVTGSARVELDPQPGPVNVDELVDAAALWMSAFLDESGRVLHEAGHLSIRHATALMDAPLQKIGFYSAFERARAVTV